MFRRFALLTLLGFAAFASSSPAQPGYAYRSQSAEPPLASDPQAAEKLQMTTQQTRPVVPNVRSYDAPAPAVTLRVQAPTTLPVGQPVEVRLVLENLSRVPAKNVMVVYALPAGSQTVKSLPPEQAPGTWRFETLAAGGRQEILLTVKPPADAVEFESKARVTIDQEQSAKTKFSKPELKLVLSSPKQALRFDILVLGLTVENHGDIELKDITVSDRLPPGLAHKPDDDKDLPFTQGPMKLTAVASEDPQIRKWKIDRLGPRESRRIEFYAVAATAPAGPIEHQAAAQAAGVQAAAADKIELVEPKLEVKIDAPPRKAANLAAPARITVANTGPRLLQNIVVTDVLDQGKADRVAAGGQKLQDRVVQWIIPSLGANTSRVLDLEVSKSDGGRVGHKVSAVYRGLAVPAEAVTEFEAAAALSVDFRGNAPTVEVGGEVTYNLNVRNSGSAAATNIRPAIELPPELTFVSAEPEHKADGGKVAFEPVASLPAGGRATFRVKAKATKPALGAAVTAELSGDPFPTGPVKRQEMTAIGGNPPAPPAPAPTGKPPLPVPVAPPGG
jgi:uncharacterized repeat protein (TIGR01451 family)